MTNAAPTAPKAQPIWRALARWSAYGVAGVLGLLLALVALVLIVLNVEPGRRAVLGFASDPIAASLGGRPSFGELGGVWPYTFRFEDVVLRDGDGAWLQVKSLQLSWRPLGLLRGRIHVDAMVVEAPTLLRTPIMPPAAPEAAPVENAPLEAFPIPNLTIERAAITNATVAEAVAPGGLRASLEGAVEPHLGEVPTTTVSLNGEAAPLTLADSPLATLSATRAALSANLSAQAEQITLDALTLSLLDGALPLARVETQGAITPDALSLNALVTATVAGLAAQDLDAEAEAILAIAATGPFDDLQMEAMLDTPTLQRANTALPPVNAQVRLESLPGALDAQLTATADMNSMGGDGAAPLTLSARLASTDWSAIRLNSLALRHDQTRLDADGAFDLTTSAASGRLEIAAPDLASLPEALGLPTALAGDVRLTAQGAYDPQVENLGEAELALTSERIAVGDITLADIALSAAGPLEAVQTRLSLGEAIAPGAPILAGLEADAALSISEGALTTRLTRLEATLDDAPATLERPATLRIAGPAITLEDLALRWGEARLTTAFDMSPDELSGRLTTEDLPLPALASQLTAQAQWDTRAAETGEMPGVLSARLTPQAPDAPAALAMEGAWSGTAVELTADLIALAPEAAFDRLSLLKATAPLALMSQEAGWRADLTGDVEAALTYDGPLETLMSLIELPDQTLTGALVADVRARGPYDAIRAEAGIRLTDGFYEHEDAGVRLHGLSLTAQGDGGAEAAALDLSITARDSTLSRTILTGDGRVEFDAQGAALTVAVALDRATLVRRGDLGATLSGDLAVEGALPKLAVSGDLIIDSVDAAIPDTPPPVAPIDAVRVVRVDADETAQGPDFTSNAAEPSPLAVALDIRIRADDRVFVRGRGLESEWTADLRIVGEAEAPRLTGTIAISEGSLDFAGRRLEITEGQIGFVGEAEPDPVLDIRAETTARTGERLFVDITGRASAPDIALSSEPALPREDVMALVLFGKPVVELTAFESLQLAQALASLGGVGPFGGRGVVDKARRSLGLDQLAITQSDSGETGLTVGKYVSDRIFVSANQDVTGEAGAVAVTIVLTDRLSLQTDVGQDASGTAGLIWSTDY